MMGDDKQIDPIGDHGLYHDGASKTTTKTVEGGPTQDALVGLGLSVRNECEDVVILRDVWRRDDGKHIADAAERERYCEEASEFVRVCRKLADCDLTREEHAWLSKRNKYELLKTKEADKSMPSSAMRYS